MLALCVSSSRPFLWTVTYITARTLYDVGHQKGQVTRRVDGEEYAVEDGEDVFVQIGSEEEGEVAQPLSLLHPLSERLTILLDALSLAVVVRAVGHVASGGALLRGPSIGALVLSVTWLGGRGVDFFKYDGKMSIAIISCRAEDVKFLWNAGSGHRLGGKDRDDEFSDVPKEWNNNTQH